jgi:protein phosphatase PTC7
MEAISRKILVYGRGSVTRSIYSHLSSVSPRIWLPSNSRNVSLAARRNNPNTQQQFISLPFLLRARSFHNASVLSSSPKFSYGIAASYTAKGQHFHPANNVFTFNPKVPVTKRRSDRRSRPDSGQDAFFVSRVGQSDDIAFGVADGVGGWVDSGVDPADFSHDFCDSMAYAASTYTHDADTPMLSAQSLIQQGYDEVVHSRTVKAGGSTACVLIARADGSLDAANLGDSGFVHLRLNAVHAGSEPQTHAFNTPYQLSIIPERMRARTAAFGGMQLDDKPKDASVSSHSLRHGDVLVVATDGVWDNLSSQDILRIVSRVMVSTRAWTHSEEGISVGETLAGFTKPPSPSNSMARLPALQDFLAIGITAEAKAASVNTKIDGPFAREVQKLYPEEDWRGGKVDDICVVVAIVVEEGQ